jgi:hypothetical protein
MTPSSPAKTRSATQGYKTCRATDVSYTLLQLDRLASGIEVHDGEEGIAKWKEWKKEGIMTETAGNNLRALCKVIGLSEKTVNIYEVFKTVVESNPAMEARAQLRQGTFPKTSLRYKIDTQFDKTVRIKPRMTPVRKTTNEDGWKVVKGRSAEKATEKQTDSSKKTEKTVTYDIMDSDIEDDGNTTDKNVVVAPDQEAKTKSHEENRENVQTTIEKATEDVRKYFENPKLKEPDKEGVLESTVGQKEKEPIRELEKNLETSMTNLGNDLTNKYTTDFERKMEEKLGKLLIEFEQKMEKIMKTSIESYGNSDEFKVHQNKILKHIDEYVPKQFQQRLSKEFNTYTEKFTKASSNAKRELNAATTKLNAMKIDYANLKEKYDATRTTLIDTVQKELEQIGDETTNELLDQKDYCIMELNKELHNHQQDLMVAQRKLRNMEEKLDKVNMTVKEVNDKIRENGKEEIVITEEEMDEEEKKMRSGVYKPEYWKLPNDDLYLKFVNGKVEEGKPLYEHKGDGLYLRVKDIKQRQESQGLQTTTKPVTSKLFPEAARLMGTDLKKHLDGEAEKKKTVTPIGKDPLVINTPDGQGGTTQVYTFDYYTFPKGYTRRLDTFKAGKVVLSEVTSASQLPTLYMQLQHNLTQHGILLPMDPSKIERWETQAEPPTIPYTIDDFDGDSARYQHIRTHSATTIYTLLKEAIDEDWVQGQSILLTEEQRCDGYAVLYRLLELTMPKLRDIDDIHSLQEPEYSTEDTPVTYANKVGNWRQQKHFENEHMTESSCFTYLITRIPRELYAEGLSAIEKTYARYKMEHNHWSRHGKTGYEPQYPRICRLSEAGAAIMNAQILHNKKNGKNDAIVRKATATDQIFQPEDQTQLESIMDQCDDTPKFIPKVHAATARELARTRQDVTCRACKQWGHCIELGGQCDFLAQTINCQHYITRHKGEKGKILKDAVVTFEERQKDRRRIIAKSGGGNVPDGQSGIKTSTPSRGRSYERSRSPYTAQRRPRTPSAVRGLAKAATGTAVTFQEDDMPYGFDDSNVLFADDDSFFGEQATDDERM